MPLVTYLKPETTLLLKGNSREAALEELIGAVCRTRPDLDAASIHRAVAEREDELNTRIAPGIALPHARISGMNGFALAVGLSPQGVTWGPETSDPPVRIVALVLGDKRRADEHIRLLGQIASLFSQRGVVDRLTGHRDPQAFYEQLIAVDAGMPADTEAHAETQSFLMLQNASQLADALDAGVVIVLGAQHTGRYLRLLDRARDRAWVLAAPAIPRERLQEDQTFDAVINIPSRGLTGRQRVDVVILIGLLKGLVKLEELAVCVYGREEGRELDTVQVVDLRHQFSELLMLSDEIRQSDTEPEVLYRVLQLANELAIEGREGRPIGTLFVLGDYEQVAAYTHQIVVNPFRGYTADERNILDPSLDETLKEFSLLDGAFVVRGDGEVMSAGTCIHLRAPAGEAVSGLGTRHTAGLAISAATDALAVVLSQSTGTVSVYKSGRRILALTRTRE